MFEREIVKIKDTALLIDGLAKLLSLLLHVLPRRLQHSNGVANVVCLLDTGQQPPHVTPTIRDHPHCRYWNILFISCCL